MGTDARQSDPTLAPGSPRVHVRPPSDLDDAGQAIFQAGVQAAPLFIGLVSRAIEAARETGADRVWYFTREGSFFQAVHDAWCQATGVRKPSDLLEVSRLSTFAASMNSVAIEELRRVWSLFSTQSLGAMLATLGCPAEPFRPIFARLGLDPAFPIHEPWNDARVQRLFTDAEFLRKLDDHRSSCRQGVLGYLKQRGIRDDGKPRVIVDIGWRGTIQDNLARLLPSTPIHGVYLAMHIVLNQQPANVTKIAYAADVATEYDRCARLLQYVQPLEMVCNSAEGSVRGYARAGLLRRWTALREPDEADRAIHRAVASQFQRGTLAAVPSWRDRAPSAGWTSAALKPHAFAALQRLIADPPMALARAFFTLRHHETFGLGATIEMSDKLGPPGPIPTPATDAERLELEARADRSNWPCAFYRIHGLESERAWFAREKLRINPSDVAER